MLVRTAFGLSTWKQPKLEINRKTTLIIDESAMVDNDKLARALRHAEQAGCRVVLVGDPKQLPAIGPGGLFREIAEHARVDQKTELTEIVRQERALRRRPCATSARATRARRTHLRRAEETSLRADPGRGRAAAHRTLERRGRARNPRGHLILASTNEEVDRLNQRAQEALREAGRLGFRSVRVGEERIHEGDRILFTDTDKRLGLVKSEFATVAHVDMLTRKVTVQIDGQEKPVTFSLRRFDAIRLGYAATTHRRGDDARPGCLCAHRWPDGLTRACLCADLACQG